MAMSTSDTALTQVEAILEEMLLLCSGCEEYNVWMLRLLAASDELKPLSGLSENEKAFRSGPFNVLLRQLIAYYINMVRTVPLTDHIFCPWLDSQRWRSKNALSAIANAKVAHHLNQVAGAVCMLRSTSMKAFGILLTQLAFCRKNFIWSRMWPKPSALTNFLGMPSPQAW